MVSSTPRAVSPAPTRAVSPAPPLRMRSCQTEPAPQARSPMGQLERRALEGLQSRLAGRVSGIVSVLNQPRSQQQQIAQRPTQRVTPRQTQQQQQQQHMPGSTLPHQHGALTQRQHLNAAISSAPIHAGPDSRCGRMTSRPA
jgi:hypothetical protein